MQPKDSLQQQVWNYIRRNPAFRYGDILMITQISDSTLERYLRKLCKVGYVERGTVATSGVKRVDSEYRVKAKLGVLAPIVNNKKYLYDPNEKVQYDLETGSVVSQEEQGNQCMRYSLLLGKEYNFLAGYKNRYNREHPELKSAKDWYLHVKNVMRRDNTLIKELKFIRDYLVKEKKINEFSKVMCERGLFVYEYSFMGGVMRIIREKKRMLMAEEILKRYETAVSIFEELYGSINTLEATV
ncbi:hypothetical protein [Sulfurospirillum cavolei]|uniref:hypothetical protein n=1 Tax=Sulfurospirillum cavolei TaxID=366522 RepID=UPI0005A6E0B7|nr:hypothetical protein [Sulfurospirillum cavolei]